MALSGGDGDREHDLDVVEPLAGDADEAQLDVEHDLPRDQQVVVERQGVLGEVDDALDRVLDRHDAAVDLTCDDGVEHVGHGRVVDQLAGGEVGLGAQRLLGERAERPEEPDPERCHDRAGYAANSPGSMGDVDEPALRALLDDLQAGRVDADDVVRRLQRLPFADVGDALVDHHRALRQGLPEAVYGPGKTPEQCVRVVGELLAHGTSPVLLTRASDDQLKAVVAEHGPGVQQGRCLLYRQPETQRTGRVLVVTAGTADRPVADECLLTLTAHGFGPDRLDDVGVAGLHRLLAHVDDITAADAVVVLAGMEGALASVVGGLTGAPVVAVPTSVGYGASLEGVTALLAMHASCAAGVTVVGIDNGYGAACAIARMLQ